MAALIALERIIPWMEGNATALMMPMITMTVSNSIRVKARLEGMEHRRSQDRCNNPDVSRFGMDALTRIGANDLLRCPAQNVVFVRLRRSSNRINFLIRPKRPRHYWPVVIKKVFHARFIDTVV